MISASLPFCFSSPATEEHQFCYFLLLPSYSGSPHFSGSSHLSFHALKPLDREALDVGADASSLRPSGARGEECRGGVDIYMR